MTKGYAMATISVIIYVDVVGALAEERLAGNLYLIDNNRTGGSTNLGTGILNTKVQKGDTLLWSVMAIEPEAYAALTEIGIDSDCCQVQRKTYQGSDVTYWEGVVQKDVLSVPYTLKLALGSREQEMVTTERPSLVGSGP
jgi:hypothetical protein